MLDVFLPYARSTRQFMYRPGDWRPDPQKREARALELRAAIERWSSPVISKESTQAARALLREDGDDVSDETWDAHEIESPPNDYLLWPEGIPLELREQARAPTSAASSGLIWGRVPRPPSRQKSEDTGVYAYPTEADYADVFHFQQWLHVLASPRILQTMRRRPTQEHLLTLVDAYLPYARSERLLSHGATKWRPDPQKREARAIELRAAIEQWTTPEISREITHAARALAREDGLGEPEEGWDAYVVELEPPPENYLVWPETVELHRKEEEKAEAIARAIGVFLRAIKPPDPPSRE
jgi:hypothetical protein